MLYIDQPYGAGFSYSTQQQRINTTDAATPLIWKFIQAFHSQFPQYESRDFGIWAESYGGRTFFVSFMAEFFFSNQRKEEKKEEKKRKETWNRLT